jgi:hypothetical protein
MQKKVFHDSKRIYDGNSVKSALKMRNYPKIAYFIPKFYLRHAPQNIAVHGVNVKLNIVKAIIIRNFISSLVQQVSAKRFNTFV